VGALALTDQLWRHAVSAHDWDLVLDVGVNHGTEATGRWAHVPAETTTLDEVIGTGLSWCAKVDAEGLEPAVLAGAAGAMSADAPWALVLEVLHLSPSYVAHLAAEHVVLLVDRRTHRLVRVPGGHRLLAEQMLTCGWLYPQDCLVASADIGATLVAA
jgi:hypothetical protein